MKRFAASLPFILVLAASAFSISLSIKPDSGSVQIRRASDWQWSSVSGQQQIAPSDSFAVDESGAATIYLGSACTVLVSASSRLALGGQGADIQLFLGQGQVFLKKSGASDLSSITINASGCAFTPVGTAAAVKITKAGEPTTAVLQGKMRIDSPTGKSVTIDAGQFGTFDPAGDAFKQGALPENALKALEKWSGATFAAAPATEPQAQVAQASTPVEQPAAAPAPAVSAPAATDIDSTPAINMSNIKLPPDTADISQKQSAPAAKTPAKPKSAPAKQAAVASAVAPAKAENKPKTEGGPEKPQWEISAGSVTVDDAQWTRLALGVDVPIWKFGIFFDLEFFIDKDGKFSDKGWRFTKDDWVESVTRKIRYLRFGHENEPVFVKVGGLDNVTLGYGFVMDRFTNMLHYPDQKLFGVQLYLNDLSPIGITLQAITPNVMEFNDKGGVLGLRAGLKPLKVTEIPLLKGLVIAGTYARDFNQFTPARKWKFKGDYRDYVAFWRNIGTPQNIIDTLADRGMLDTTKDLSRVDTTFRDSTLAFSVLGADIGLPIIQSSLLNLDVYGQVAKRMDNVTGWGIGAPGAKLTVGPFWAQAEYRHIAGQFEPGYFGPYYLDERVTRYPSPVAKSQALPIVSLNGVFGSLGLNIVNALIISGTYQYLIGPDKTYSSGAFQTTARALDQRFEATAGLGDFIVQKIPKLSKIEGYFAKTNISRSYSPITGKPDGFLEKTPDTYYGYRLGVKISEGAALIWDARYGWKYDNNQKLVPNNNIIIQTAVTF
jgi:hypothetical protein